MISWLVLKYLKGEGLVILRGYERPLPASSQVNLTKPSGLVLKYLKGERLVMARSYATALPGSSHVPLT
jgi:hypothetical protein